MQAALPLDKPVQAHSLSLAVIVLSAIVATPSPIPKPSDTNIPGPVFESRTGSIFWANHVLKESAQVNLDLKNNGIAGHDSTRPEPGVPDSGIDGGRNDFQTGTNNLNAEEIEEKINNSAEKARAEITQHALNWVGVPYLWGGETRAGIDCSALVQRVYLSQGIQLPRTSYEQFRVGVGVPAVNLQPGDLVFFSTAGSGASHVGIYLGNGEFLSATRRQVEVQSMESGYWKNAYRGSRRILNATASAQRFQLPF